MILKFLLLLQYILSCPSRLFDSVNHAKTRRDTQYIAHSPCILQYRQPISVLNNFVPYRYSKGTQPERHRDHNGIKVGLLSVSYYGHRHIFMEPVSCLEIITKIISGISYLRILKALRK